MFVRLVEFRVSDGARKERSTSAPSVPHTATVSDKKYIYRMQATAPTLATAGLQGRSYGAANGVIETAALRFMPFSDR